MPAPCRRAALPALLAATLAACGNGAANSDAGGPDGAPDASVYEPPRDDLVPAVGSDDTIDLATWNIENFPAAPATPRLVADLIVSLQLDLVAVEEIADIAAFDELVARLPDHAGLLSSHTYGDGSYQKVGFIYREGLLDLAGGALLFDSEGFDFPRPALSVQVTVDGKTFTAVVLHLKAGGTAEDRMRRTGAIVTLEAHLRQVVDGTGDDDVVVLGDYNQTRLSVEDDAVWAPILGAPDRYQILSQAAADGGEVSYLGGSGRLIDHAVVTMPFELGTATANIPRLDQFPIGYTDNISDHLPVVFSFPR